MSKLNCRTLFICLIVSFSLTHVRAESAPDLQNWGYAWEEYDSTLFYRLQSVSDILSYADSALGKVNRTTRAYSEFLAIIIHKRFYHGYSYYSPNDNWVAWVAGTLFWDHLHAIVLPEDIMKHPNAACSQQAIVLKECFVAAGIDYREVDLNGHFVLEGKVEGEWLLFDTNMEPQFPDGRKSLNALIRSGELAVASVLSLLCGTNYMPIAIMFAFFSFTGIWAMYRTFANLYPKLHKELAVAFLFIPSTFVWGSAVFKDTICMFGLGWLTYTTFRIFVNRDFSPKNIILLVSSFYLIGTVKIYILLGFVPALAIWLLTTYSSKIKSVGVRVFVKLIFFAISIGSFLFFTNLFAKELNKYSLENIAGTAAVTRSWLAYSSGDEGSAYDLGEFDPSIGGMLKKFPQAVVVTLFRPFPWEARKVIVLLSAIEALIFAYFTVKAFRKNGIKDSLKIISKDPNVLFCLIFSIVFAFAVGISSYNFGSLSRYKIPALPFYGAFLMILLHQKRLKPNRGTTIHVNRRVNAPA